MLIVKMQPTQKVNLRMSGLGMSNYSKWVARLLVSKQLGL